MSRKANANIFVGDRAYQTTFFLNFKSAKSEQKFQFDTFLRTKSFLQGYFLISITYLIWNFFNSSCFHFSHGCKQTNLLIASLFCLIATFPVLKMNQAILLRLLLFAPSLYVQLTLMNNYSYHLTVHLIVVHTTLTSIKLFFLVLYSLNSCLNIPYMEIPINIQPNFLLCSSICGQVIRY